MNELKQLSINGFRRSIEKEEKTKHNYGQMCQIMYKLYRGY